MQQTELLQSSLLESNIAQLKSAMRSEEGIAITYALGRIALSAINSELPVDENKTRFFRGEFARFDINEMLKKLINSGIVSQATEILGERLQDLVREEHGIDISSSSISELAKYHQKGVYTNIWKNGAMHTITITPFTSLTSNIEVAMKSAVNLLEMKAGIEMGLYVNDDGTYSSAFFQKIKDRISVGFAPIIYVIDAPSSAITDVQSVRSMRISETDGLVIKNSMNEYNEEEYITLSIHPSLIKGVMAFTGNPYEPRKEDYWQFFRL